MFEKAKETALTPLPDFRKLGSRVGGWWGGGGRNEYICHAETPDLVGGTRVQSDTPVGGPSSMAGWEKGLFRTTHQRENVSGLLLLITLPPDWLVGEVQEVSGRYQFEKLFQNRIS